MEIIKMQRGEDWRAEEGHDTYALEGEKMEEVNYERQ